MRKLSILLLIFVLGINFSYSQIQQGKRLIGLSLSGDFNTEKIKPPYDGKSNSYSIGLSPSYGIFLSTNVLVGLSVAYNFSYYEYNTTDIAQSDRTDLHRSHQIALAPFARYYINIGTKFYFFMQGTFFAGYNYRVVYSNGFKQDDQGSNDFSCGIAFNPGINYFISEKFLLEFTFGSLGYTHLNSKTYTTDDINLSLNFSNISLGLMYMF